MAAAIRAFDILYREYYVRVFGLCRRLLNSATLAEDATQETFMRAYKNFSRYDNQQPFWQWIASVANHYCIDVLRQRQRTQKLFDTEQDEVEQIESPGPHGVAELIRGEDQESLNAALQTMPDKYRVPLVLLYFSEMSYDQIAQELELTRSHVGVLLLRAKQHLRNQLLELEKLKESNP
jgi:RNA polymerase sigma-70 factor (ECF subfamily)